MLNVHVKQNPSRIIWVSLNHSSEGIRSTINILALKPIRSLCKGGDELHGKRKKVVQYTYSQPRSKLDLEGKSHSVGTLLTVADNVSTP